jgi:hypothetical protein
MDPRRTHLPGRRPGSRSRLSLAALPLLLACLLLSGCDYWGLDVHDEDVTITYRFEGTCSGDIVYTGRNGKTHILEQVESGWKTNFVADSDDYLFVSATNNCSVGTISVKIFRDGRLYKSKTESGAFVTVSAAGQA